MSLVGTKRSWRCCHRMSVVRGEVENICSQRVFRLLTRKRHQCFGLSFPRRLPTQPWGADVSKDERAMAEASRYGAAKSS
jgi:hypothetical protein